MNQKHVPDLELCQEFERLCKEKGIVVPETEFYWVTQKEHICPREYDCWDMGQTTRCRTLNTSKVNLGTLAKRNGIPAPLVSEQGEWLPLHYMTVKNKEWHCENLDLYIEPDYKPLFGDDKEANARQKCINYAIAEGIITTL